MHIAVNYKTDSCYRQMNISNRNSGDERQLLVIALISRARTQIFKCSHKSTEYFLYFIRLMRT